MTLQIPVNVNLLSSVTEIFWSPTSLLLYTFIRVDRFRDILAFPDFLKTLCVCVCVYIYIYFYIYIYIYIYIYHIYSPSYPLPAYLLYGTSLNVIRSVSRDARGNLAISLVIAFCGYITLEKTTRGSLFFFLWYIPRTMSRHRRRPSDIDTIDATRRANDDVDNDDDGPPPALERVSTTRLRCWRAVFIARRHSRWVVSRVCIEWCAYARQGPKSSSIGANTYRVLAILSLWKLIELEYFKLEYWNNFVLLNISFALREKCLIFVTIIAW